MRPIRYLTDLWLLHKHSDMREQREINRKQMQETEFTKEQDLK